MPKFIFKYIPSNSFKRMNWLSNIDVLSILQETAKLSFNKKFSDKILNENARIFTDQFIFELEKEWSLRDLSNKGLSYVDVW